MTETEARLLKREQFIQYISDEYGVDEEYLFAKHPLFCVFRHSNNPKWFAVVMDVPKNKLGLEGADALDVVNLKCDPILIGSLRKEPGIFPAYHMSKANWVSVALDGSVPDEQIKLLLDMSYDATAPKIKKNQTKLIPLKGGGRSMKQRTYIAIDLKSFLCFG